MLKRGCLKISIWTEETMTLESMMKGDTSVSRVEIRDTRSALGVRRVQLLLASTFVAVGLCAASCGGGSPSNSTSANSLVSQGLRAESAGHLQQAAKDFMAATAKDHKNASAYYQLGVLYQHFLNKPAQAAIAYKKALVHKPNDRAAMYKLAVLDTLSTPQAAQNLYARLLVLDPHDARVNFNLGLLLIEENQPVPGHAYLKKAISLDPSLAKRVPSGITP
jgi:tetratricopeptide (TPR) repeat protein